MAINPTVTSVATVKELIAELRKIPAGSTWMASSGGYGFASVHVYDKDGKHICEIINKG